MTAKNNGGHSNDGHKKMMATNHDNDSQQTDNVYLWPTFLYVSK